MGRTEELSDIKCGTVIACHLCHKSVHGISPLLAPPSTTGKCRYCEMKGCKRNSCSGTKWWTTQIHRVVPHSAKAHSIAVSSSVASLTTERQTASGSNISTRTEHWDLHKMCFHGWAATHKSKITMHSAKCWLEWCKGNVFSGMMNHTSLSGSPMDESRFGRCQENSTYWNA